MEVKQVIVIRKDLNMRKGKMCAQASHASMGDISMALRSLMKCNPLPLIKIVFNKEYREWLKGSFTKIVVSVSSEEELLALKDKCVELDTVHYLIQDNGATEFHGEKTYTALAVGPASVERVNRICKDLKLL